MLKENLVVNGVHYEWKENFDINLTLDYENDSWGEWHVLREMISNSLDCVGGDKNRISINSTEESITISDGGEGYSIILAKRIGASSKKGDKESIGQFGEGTKMALLTCLRLGIDVYLGSQNWLIQPFENQLDGQRVLFYRVYETETSIKGSFVQLEATKKLQEYIDQLGDLFLIYSDTEALWNNNQGGIYPRNNQEHIGKIFNKGVFIREVPALFNYGISMEKLNRDRDLVDLGELAEQVRDLIKETDHEEIIKTIIETATLEEEAWRALIEFRSYLYTNQDEKWATAFYSLFGDNAVLSTNNLASLECQLLNYHPVKLQSQIHRILKDAGVSEDIAKLREDYQIQWVSPGELTTQERETLKQAKECAAAINWEYKEEIRVFSKFHNSEDVTGLYLKESKTIGIKRSLLEKGLSSTLGTFLHELAHLHSGADDYSREFAAAINEKLTETLLQLVAKNGVPTNVKLDGLNLILPSDLSLSAQDLSCHIIIIETELIIKTSQHKIRIPLFKEMEPTILKRKIKLSGEGFCVRLSEDIIEALNCNQDQAQTILCHKL